MKRASRTLTVTEHSRENAPQFAVKPGETFEAETQLCSGDWLQNADDVWRPEKVYGPNPTVVVAVEGAAPGDSLRVYIENIIPDNVGYTGFIGREHRLANRIIDRDWGNNLRVVRIDGGFIEFGNGRRIPVNPMIGTLGTAPAGNPVSNADGGRHGGNMDAQVVRAGAVITLPVEVPGALLHIGDVHAVQGDGEINGAGGIECRALVTLRAEIISRPARTGCVRAEDYTHIHAIACGGEMNECCVAATRELLYWIADDYGADEREAYLLLGQYLELRVPQMVNPTRTIIASVAKSDFI
jgi:acetamidase/formamidase